MFLEIPRAINVIQGCIIVVQIGPISLQKEIFWKIDWCYFCLSIVLHPTTKLQKYTQRVNHET